MIRIHSTQLDIRKIAESGQCFRLNEISDCDWQLVAFGHVLNIREIEPYTYEFDCKEAEMAQLWYHYFDWGTDYDDMMKHIPKEDLFVREAVKFGKGMRILRQDPWEMLVSFIISQRKNISGIKKCIESLSLQFGEKIDNREIFSFPTPEALAAAPEDSLCKCSLGYRLPYVRKAAQMVASGELNLKGLAALSPEALPDTELLSCLMSVPGVGPKVAQCVMLFGFHRLDAFPVDVWIDRVIRGNYNGRFPIEEYAGFSGVVQQYIFYYARKGNFGGY